MVRVGVASRMFPGEHLLQDSVRLGRKGDPMGDKSPKKDNAKKPAQSLKEKRAAKHEKQRESRGGLGSR